MPRLASLLLVLSLLTLPSRARADVIGPDHRTRDCPAGSWGSFPHGTGPCRAIACTDDGACFGNRCEATALCLDGEEVVSACDAKGACARGSCQRAKRCVPKSAPAPPPSATAGGPAPVGTGGGPAPVGSTGSTSKGCSLGPLGADAEHAGPGLLMLAALLLRRTRPCNRPRRPGR